MRYGKKKIARRVARKLRRRHGKRYEPRRPWPLWVLYAAILLAAAGAIRLLLMCPDFPTRVFSAIFIVPLAVAGCVAAKALHWIAN